MNTISTFRLQCSECPIRHRAVCSRCNDDELALLDAIKVYRTFRPGETILWRGDDLFFVASVVSGVATLGKTMEDGRTQMVGLLLPSDFIGHPRRKKIEFDVVAVSEVVLCCFERRPFEELVRSTPNITERLMEIALDELDAAREWMVLLGRKTAKEKIATFLAMLTVRQVRDDAVDAESLVELPLTREETANFLGLTLETVSRQITKLRADGVLRFHDRAHFEVLDANALRIASGDDL